MKMPILILPVLLTAGIHTAQAGASAPKPDDMYFTSKSVPLTARERDALSSSAKWRSSSATEVQPVAGPDGAIRYLFGAQQPSIICAVLQVCDIELQPGEQVNSIHLGDTTRWNISPALTGSGPAEIQHLIVKPLDVGLETSLIVTTDRRTYHFRLRSHRTEFMSRVGFTYPEDSAAKWLAVKQKESKALEERQEKTLPQTGEYLGDLNFSYTLDGSAVWKPVRVYNNGVKTIIQMPTAMNQTEAPTLLVVRKDGGWFSDGETVMVNYRLQGDRFIVDTVFDKAILIAGVGGNQDRVTIIREK